MSDSLQTPSNQKLEQLSDLLRAGSEIASGAAGAGIGLFLGGPLGAYVGGAAGPLLTNLASEFWHRTLSKREKSRVGAALGAALRKTQENLRAGKVVNESLLGNEEERSSASEICEAVIVAVQRDPQEKKLQYYSNLIGNLPFEEHIDASEAFLLTRLAEQLTYRQLCLLAIFGENPRLGLRDNHYIDYPHMTSSLLSVLLEIYELWTRQLIESGNSIINRYDHIQPSRIYLHGIGGRLFRLMELDCIPPEDIEEVKQFLR